MAKGYVLYNPLAGNGEGAENAKLLQMVLDEELEFIEVIHIINYSAFLSGMEAEDYLVLVGGDGTLNRFINDTDGISVRQEILYFPAGTGNDFAADLGYRTLDNPFPITQYLKGLPSVEVKGKKYRFLNGVGFGLDGYCCQVGDEERKRSGNKVNYAAVALKGLLLHFVPRNAKVTVDGKEYTYTKVWIAPTMYGRCYGGGMIPVPQQERSSGQLSVMLFHGAGRLKTLCVFPGIFSGQHMKYKNLVTIHTGRVITVEFDQPTSLQVDGETILNATSYTASVPNGSENRKVER